MLKIKMFLLCYVGVKLDLFHLKGEYRLRVLDSRVLRKIFEWKKAEVTENCRKLRNDYRMITSRKMRQMGVLLISGDEKCV